MPKRILVVEDESDIRDAIAASLSQVNYEVLTAENGQIGIETAFREHPDLILLDLKMPVMTGQEMLQLLRIDPWGKTAKVIILTSMDDPGQIKKAYEEQVHDYIIKAQMSLEEVRAVVNAVLEAE